MADSGTPVALDDLKTRKELDRYRGRSMAWLAGGLVASVPGALLMAPLLDFDEDISGGQVLPAMLVMAGAILAILCGGGGLARAGRMRRRLRRHSWRPWASNFTQEKIGNYERNQLSLSPEGRNPDRVVVTVKLPSMLRTNLSRSGPVGAREVDVAGDPASGSAVVRARGHEHLIPVRKGSSSVTAR